VPAVVDVCDVVILGAGAAGLMCAIEAGRRGRRVLVVDHGDMAGRKIEVSGGGRCNFTNIRVEPENYISRNPHFCKSALTRYTPEDFLELLRRHRVAYEEREHGRLFCAGSSRDILGLLLKECRQAGVSQRLSVKIRKIGRRDDGWFRVAVGASELLAHSLVVATGGLAMPALGATDLGYAIARQFQIAVQPPSAGLVPLTYSAPDRQKLSGLSGISLEARVAVGRRAFTDKLLFTHRGLSGPAVLQISSYWQPGQALMIDLLPSLDLSAVLAAAQSAYPRRKVKTALAEHLPKRLVDTLVTVEMGDQVLGGISRPRIDTIAAVLKRWPIVPEGSEGYRTAEVTVGGVDCDAISSRTMEAAAVPGLFFCGEVLDVTGWLGGYNLQWAWSSGWCAGQYA
jgi:predicted Rossmann fold flavoprotein